MRSGGHGDADEAVAVCSEGTANVPYTGTLPELMKWSDKMSKFEEARRKIQSSGRLLYRICFVGMIAEAVFFIAQLVITGLVFVNKEVASMVHLRLRDNFLFNVLRSLSILDGMEPKYQAAVGCGVLLSFYFTVFMMLRLFSGLLKFFAEGEHPFDSDMAKRIRNNSFYLLLFILYNPILGIATFSLTLLFSYIMEYGAYIQQRADETNRIQEEMIVSFAEITENKSGQTGQHIKRVSEYSRILAETLGMSREKADQLGIASTMHDVGKLLIPSAILDKPGKLTDEEYAEIKKHTTYGGQLLQNVEGEEMELSRTVALQHHERYDGNGYPAKLKGDEISLEGRIVAVADVYDALTSRRSYKDAWSEDTAYQEILKGRGTQFDPSVVDAFVSAHDKILQVRAQNAD